MKNTLAYVDHNYHIKTKSGDFLREIFKSKFKIKNYWIWSSFATKELHRLGHTHVKTMHGCIETDYFYPLEDAEKKKLRQRHNIEEDAFIVGFVFRNQLRKSVPNLLEGYAKWKEQEKTEEEHQE